jgi:protein TonB
MFQRVYGPRHRPRTILPGSTLISLGVHGTALAVAAITGASAAHIADSVSGGIIFLAPPPNASAGPTGAEQITFSALAGIDGDAGLSGIEDGATAVEAGLGIPRGGEEAGSQRLEQVIDPGLFDVPADSIYLASQVDNPVAYDPNSAAPAYPDSLRRNGVEGQVTAQFVVDTSGHVDVESFVLLESSHGRFTESVRQALPRMLFRPAEINGHKIRQLVQIPFVFKITVADTAGRGAATADTVSQPDTAAQLVRNP